jgi:hypothetical protein
MWLLPIEQASRLTNYLTIAQNDDHLASSKLRADPQDNEDDVDGSETLIEFADGTLFSSSFSYQPAVKGTLLKGPPSDLEGVYSSELHPAKRDHTKGVCEAGCARHPYYRF